jgi:hypothetical protein
MLVVAIVIAIVIALMHMVAIMVAWTILCISNRSLLSAGSDLLLALGPASNWQLRKPM